MPLIKIYTYNVDEGIFKPYKVYVKRGAFDCPICRKNIRIGYMQHFKLHGLIALRTERLYVGDEVENYAKIDAYF